MLTKTKKNKFQRVADQQGIVRLYLKQKSQREIADSLSLTPQYVGRQLKAIKDAWMESTMVDFNKRQNEELARIDALEAEYWGAWESSKLDESREAMEYVEEDSLMRLSRKRIETIKRNGTSAFLHGIQWCIEQRCKILGLHAPKEIKIDQPQRRTKELPELTREELRQIIAGQSKALAVDAEIVPENDGRIKELTAGARAGI